VTVSQDYLAGTDPNNASSILKITSENISPGGTHTSLTWNSVPSRYYYLQKATNITTHAWIDSGLSLIPPSARNTTTASFTDAAAPVRYYRIQAVRPLTP